MNNDVTNSFLFEPPQLQEFFQYAYTLCQNQDDAYDFLQAALEKYLGELQTGKVIANPSGYLRTIIRNKYIDFYRSRQRWQSELFEEQAPYDISSIDVESLNVSRSVLAKIWTKLASEDRDILYHWAILGYSTDEACELLNLPRGTFLSRLHRLRKFCQQLQEDETKESKP